MEGLRRRSRYREKRFLSGQYRQRSRRKRHRFTANKAGKVVYALVLGWPAGEIAIQSLGTGNDTKPGKIAHVELLGTGERLRWRQSGDALRVTLPPAYKPVVDFAAAFRVTLA